jgi:hypothetical protein
MADMEQSSGPGDGQKLAFTLTILPPGSTVDGVPVYTVSDPALIAVSDLSADGLSGFITNLNVVGGPATVHVEGDADLGAGVTTISVDSEPINVTAEPAAPATGFGFAFTPVAA